MPPLVCAIQGPSSTSRATSAIAASGTHSRTSSGVLVGQFDAALAQPGGDRRADAAGADDLNGFDCHPLQFRSGYRAERSLVAVLDAGAD